MYISLLNNNLNVFGWIFFFSVQMDKLKSIARLLIAFLECGLGVKNLPFHL